ncbi:hypothetical protein CYY_008632 [Polysphondylium violaceum]|uniref:Phosphoribulokinase/uridine kinase domain-containing protein n=1 Tax=Polysphondylium violaceum TaxID=133409 RepID=A0A8J4UWS7_9MYCE|nr:hypothetical protein CYY_008632 [Polysphondylium violaceum]
MTEDQNIQEIIEKLYQSLINNKYDGEKRVLYGLAGAPASGKSTLSSRLVQYINEKAGKDIALVVPMDGFHLDNCILDKRGVRAVKGSPQTFDCAGFVSLLKRLVEDNEDIVYIPTFDRHLDLSRNCASVVTKQHRILIVEGNYLLLNQDPWTLLKPLFNATVFLQVEMDELKKRLIQRWLTHGHDQEAAEKRALSNDIPNAELVLTKSNTSDYLFKN